MPKTLSSGVRFVLGLISFLLCILLFVSSVATILVSDILVVLTSQDNLKKLFSQVLSADLPRPLPRGIASDGGVPCAYPVVVKKMASPGLRLEETNAQAGDALVVWIYETLSKQYSEEMDLSLETVQDFVARSTLKEFVAEKGASLVSDFYTGENTTTLTEAEIQSQLEQNADLIREIFGYEVTSEAIAEITKTITENDYLTQIREEGIVNVVLGSASNKPGNSTSGGTSGSHTDSESFGTSIQELLDLFRKVASLKTLLICIGICLLLIGLLFVTNWKRFWAAMNSAGITLSFAGLFYLVPTVLVWTLPTTWTNSLGDLHIVGILTREILIMTSGVCIGVFALGVVLLAGGITTKCIFRKKAVAAPVAAVGAAPVAVDETVAMSEEPIAEEPEKNEPAAKEAPAEAEVSEETPVARDVPESV